MEITINDISFMFPFYEEERLLRAVRQFIHVCKILESGSCHCVTALVRSNIDMSWSISPRYNIYRLIQQISDRGERSYFLSLLTNRGKRGKADTPAETFFTCQGKQSAACASAAGDGAVVSLESDEEFLKPVIMGKIGKIDVEIDNVSNTGHLKYHREKLGIRIYEANDKKHKREKENFYGKGKVASPMDLPDEEAQKLLDRAIWIKGRLYARRGIHNYAFPESRKGVFHGYIADDLKEDILTELYKKKWD